MSFYGTSYHYTAESFATVALQNAGLKNYTSNPTSASFKEASSTSEADYLKAFQRDTGLGLQSGNYWIKLFFNGNDVQIIHNKPDENASNTMLCFDKDSNPPKNAVKAENVLSFGDVLKIPTISYDEAGHIANVQQATYFQLPYNPAVTLETRMQAIDGLPKEIPGKPSLKSQLEGRMEDIEDTMNKMADESDSESLISQLNTMRSEFQEALETIEENTQAANSAAEAAEKLTTSYDTFSLAFNDLVKQLSDKGIITT